MNEVNKTLFIPLYGKSKVSKQGIILKDPDAEKIWKSETFPINGKSASKWLAYNMAMRARVFDDWTERMLDIYKDALVLQVGCGLDSRCNRVKRDYKAWLDCDFSDVLSIRKKYYKETVKYHMVELDATKPEQIGIFPDSDTVILVLEGLSMYLSKEQLHNFLKALEEKYPKLHILMDVYTEFGAKASKYKNPVNEVGVTKVYGIDQLEDVLRGMNLRVQKEHIFTPEYLVKELKPLDRSVFRFLFTGKAYRKIYRLYELS
ncbi:MAG: class I SAM-dependent methyltransferase [Lachnospiraceae bacterium]|nr:class I SAM-dependent methyltransferase [Lachnospiraceae bacterium]